ncbi:MAG: hypothetical protein U5K38_02380 [Woeseiaceae bacterium]|nr:hypothetical protein [Woeseiaceae bacterium]
MTLLVPVFFKISINPVFELPINVQVPDPEQEARFEACYAERDRRIHQQAFDTIDNPDVQREFISMHRDRARVECRQRYPRRAMMVRRPFRINLFDLQPRFGNP